MSIINSQARGSSLFEISIALALFSIIFYSLSFSLAELHSLKTTISTHQQLLEQATHALEQKDFSHLEIHYLTPCEYAATAYDLLTELMIDKNYIKDLGYDCGGITSETPLSFHQTFNLLASSSFSISDVVNTLLYNLNEHSLQKISLADISHPFILKSITFATTTSALDATRDYIFVGLNSPSNQLSLLSATDLTLLAKTSLPHVTGSYPGVTSLFYYHEKLFVGTHRTAGNEFHIFDVHNPYNPIWLGSIELNHNINDIVVKDDYAYLATSGNTKDIIILNVHDPTHIAISSTIDLPGSEDSLCLALIGDQLHIGRTKSNVSQPEYIIVSVKDPTQPHILGSFNTEDSVRDITVIHEMSYLAISGTQPYIKVLDTRDSAHILDTNSILLGGSLTSFDYQNKNIIGLNQNGSYERLYAY